MIAEMKQMIARAGALVLAIQLRGAGSQKPG
jgi:hypothetical protein